MSNLPYSLEAEKAVLGSLLIDSSVTFLATPLLEVKFFWEKSHQLIYQAILDVITEGIPVDFVTASSRLQQVNKLDEVGGINYLTELMQSTPSSLHAEYYASIVKNYHRLRSLITTAHRIIKNAESAGPDEVASALDESLDALYGVFGEKERIKNSSYMMDEFLNHFEKRYNNPSQTDISTGFLELDAVIGGYIPTDLIVIAGRPSWGKTAFMMNSMLKLSRAGIPSVLFAYEMSRVQTEQRFIALESGIALQKIKTASGLSQTELDKVVQAASDFTNYRLYIDNHTAGDVYYLTSAIRQYVQQFGIKVIFIDYLQRIPTLGQDLTQETGKITTILKTLATSLGITIVLVCQLNRDIERRQGKPILSDLRQSGRIEEDSDVVLFIHRDPDGDTPEDTEVIIGKNRNGPIGSFTLYFDQQTTKFIGRER